MCDLEGARAASVPPIVLLPYKNFWERGGATELKKDELKK